MTSTLSESIEFEIDFSPSTITAGAKLREKRDIMGCNQCWAGHPCAMGIPAGVSHGIKSFLDFIPVEICGRHSKIPVVIPVVPIASDPRYPWY